MPHEASAEPADVAGFIAFIAAGDYDVEGLGADIEDLWHAAREIPWLEIAAIAGRHRRSEQRRDHLVLSERPRSGMSREGFSRLFHRRVGMPPHAFTIARRLNEARRLLRQGEPIAAVAAATRFADQSHLGRCFRRAFGVTPGAYGRSFRAVTNVPDA